MAETLYFKDGSMEVLIPTLGADRTDLLERIIYERLGSDVARCFRECVASLNLKIEDQRIRADEFERSADGYLSLCQEAVENFQAILPLLEADRLDRKALKKAVMIGYNALHQNL